MNVQNNSVLRYFKQNYGVTKRTKYCALLKHHFDKIGLPCANFNRKKSSRFISRLAHYVVNMAAEKLVRDVGDVYKKLFDHNGPISRETNFYVQEFESKRKDRELSRLNQSSVNCSHIETLLPQVEDLSKKHLDVLLEKTDDAIKKANVMLENKLPEENVVKVEERRRKMEEEWNAFEAKTNASREHVEQCHIERMEKLKEDMKRFAEETKGK